MALHKIFYNAEKAINYIKNFYKIFKCYDIEDGELSIEFNKKFDELEQEAIKELMFRLKWKTWLKFDSHFHC